MEKYIPLDAVLAEIKRYKHKADERLKIKNRTLLEESKDIALQNLCGNLLHYVNSLELKEVDLEEEIERVRKTHFINDDFEKATLEGRQITNIAKHFFELGLKAQIMTSKLQQRISVLKMEFWTGLQTFENSEMTLSDAYSQGINDILEELSIKSQKGE